MKITNKKKNIKNNPFKRLISVVRSEDFFFDIFNQKQLLIARVKYTMSFVPPKNNNKIVAIPVQIQVISTLLFIN
jgi:hypothetical protein